MPAKKKKSLGGATPSPGPKNSQDKGGRTPQQSPGLKRASFGSAGGRTPDRGGNDAPGVLLAQLRGERLAAPTCRLHLPVLDMKRAGIRVGEWVMILEAHYQDSHVPRVAVARAWPASPTLSSGMAMSSWLPLVWTLPESSQPSMVWVLALRACPGIRVRQAASITCRCRPSGAHAPNSKFTGIEDQAQRLLQGNLVFNGLELRFGNMVAQLDVTETVPSTDMSNSSLTEDQQANLDLEARLSLLSLEESSLGPPKPPPLVLCSVEPDTVITTAVATSTVQEPETSDTPPPEPGPPSQDPSVCWRDVGGLESQIQELVECLKVGLLSRGKSSVFTDTGLRPPRGVLVWGPPGTGKSMMLSGAGRFCRSNGVHVLSVVGPEVINHRVGETEANLRHVFQEATNRSPCLIVIDEVDALASKREASTSDVEKRMVSTLLALMDGFDPADNVMILAATNRPQALDPAIRRPGRLDREIDIGVPGEQAREAILRAIFTNLGLWGQATTTPGVDEGVIQSIANRAHGFVGADLLLVCKEAVMAALGRARTVGQTGKPLNKSQLTECRRTIGCDMFEGDLLVNEEDLRAGLAKVHPSALREVAVEVPRVHWTDIGGQHQVKQALRETVEWPLVHPHVFTRMGIEPPKGVLLYGPPGCSKTLMARALATESSMNFLAVKGPELLSKWLGESERAVQSLFNKARSAAPTIIFFDEVDALARARGVGTDSKASDRVLSQLLTELDGIQPLKRVVVIAATNRPDLIDPALLRPGRIDRKIYVPPPDGESRVEILKIALRGVPVEDTLDIHHVSRLTEGLSGAELVAVCREGAMMAIQEAPEHASLVRQRHLEEAISQWKPQISTIMIQFYRQFRASGS